MKLLRSAAMAFSMFSRIPMPKVEWKKENMQYMLAFFPLIGCVIGLLMWCWLGFCNALNISNFLFAAGMMLISLLITGGIHLDGFCDTVDALASHTTTERKHEIMKDSHIGSFAVISLVTCFIVSFALYAEMRSQKIVAIACILPVLSRILSAFASTAFKKYHAQGLLSTFSDGTNKKVVLVFLLIFFLMCLASLSYVNIYLGLAALVSGLLSLVYVYFMSKNKFGGMSGDIAGFLLTVSELTMLFFVYIAWRIFSL
ncbi:MAG: adenosylcobinamide-GDP ribazoletransferase [Clostridia bacterium]|nr:adenosylcobinamide-GDP ribazoletransferase [Clostridia bacterium]